MIVNLPACREETQDKDLSSVGAMRRDSRRVAEGVFCFASRRREVLFYCKVGPIFKQQGTHFGQRRRSDGRA